VIRVHREPGTSLGIHAPDVYFLPGYGPAAAIADHGEWVLYEAYDGAYQVPLVLRTLSGGDKDAISPAYSGVVSAPGLSTPQIHEAWSASVENLRERGVISVVLRQSPLFPQPSGLPGLHSITSGRPTIVVETADEESAWNGMAGTGRTRVRKALKNGYTGTVRPVDDNDLLPHADFRRLYEQTMTRIAADSLYFFGDDYYAALLAGLGMNLLLAEVRNVAGAVVATALLLRHEKRLHYHLTGSNVDDARMGVNNLMLWTATKYAATQRLHQFHLGGGNTPYDSLFRFKRTFGGRELEYGVWGQVINDERYQVHTRNRAESGDITLEALLEGSFFPAYRGVPPPGR
jgi:serine/alanine adding enzyme